MGRIAPENGKVPTATVIGLLSILMLAAHADGHAILTDVSPAAGSQITGQYVEIKLRFNVRVDHSRSRLFLVSPGGALKSLPLRSEQRAEVLSAEATGLAAGSYKLRWQVLANDGHVTRGEVPFTVLAP